MERERESAEAYPLQWPAGVERTVPGKRARARFGQVGQSSVGSWKTRNPISLAAARDGVLHQITLLGARYPVISTNLALRLDGLPRSGQRTPDDPGVAVYFFYEGAQRVLACDRWDRVEDNLRAVEKTLDALRGIDRWGVSEILQRTFSGFKALPQNGSGRAWWTVLGVAKDATMNDIIVAYRREARLRHPDQGGNRAQWDELQEAYGQAKSARGQA